MVLFSHQSTLAVACSLLLAFHGNGGGGAVVVHAAEEKTEALRGRGSSMDTTTPATSSSKEDEEKLLMMSHLLSTDDIHKINKYYSSRHASRFDPIGNFYVNDLIGNNDNGSTLPSSDRLRQESHHRGRQLDQVFLDDVIGTFSLCVGNDCSNGENFNFDTIRLKENNLRIHFDDTSASASFPGNDWRIVINDSSNGGSNYFAVEDATAGRIPFKVEAGAPADSLLVSPSGSVGVGTSSPEAMLHVVSGVCPALLLEQDGSAGLNAQKWEIKNDGAELKISSNGVDIVRIDSAAPADSLVIDGTGTLFSKGMAVNTARRHLHEEQVEEEEAPTLMATTAKQFGGVVLPSAFDETTGKARVTLPNNTKIANSSYHVTVTPHTNDPSTVFHVNVMDQDEDGFAIVVDNPNIANELTMMKALKQVTWMIQVFPINENYSVTA